jgi:hypothetical protein
VPTTMQSVFETTIPAGSVFDPSQYDEALAAYPLGSALLPFMLYGLFSDEPATTGLLDAIRGETVSVGDLSVLWLDEDPLDAVSPHLPLDDHRPLPHTAELRALLTGALAHLSTFAPAKALFGEFVRVTSLVELKPEARGRSSLVTTSSFPVLPFCVFLSERSTRQLPPRAVGRTPSPRVFAENLYHEAIHQALNVHLLLNDILVPTYDSATSPKIDIYWRELEDFSGDESVPAGHQQWELDRVLHACVVYALVLEYRLRQLADPGLLPFERALFEEATRTSVEAVSYLSTAMNQQDGFLTPDGKRMTATLAELVRGLTSRAGATVR